jgi:hypothetical protein
MKCSRNGATARFSLKAFAGKAEDDAPKVLNFFFNIQHFLPLPSKRDESVKKSPKT